MLNEEKIKTMTQLAVYDDKRRSKDMNIVRIEKKEYIRREIVFIIVTMTAFSMYVYYFLFLDRYSELQKVLGHVIAIITCIAVFLIIALLMIAYVQRIYVILTEKYDKTEKRLTYYLRLLKIVDSIYKEGHYDHIEK